MRAWIVVADHGVSSTSMRAYRNTVGRLPISRARPRQIGSPQKSLNEGCKPRTESTRSLESCLPMNGRAVSAGRA
jgi:hypothetical protein